MQNNFERLPAELRDEVLLRLSPEDVYKTCQAYPNVNCSFVKTKKFDEPFRTQKQEETLIQALAEHGDMRVATQKYIINEFVDLVKKLGIDVDIIQFLKLVKQHGKKFMLGLYEKIDSTTEFLSRYPERKQQMLSDANNHVPYLLWTALITQLEYYLPNATGVSSRNFIRTGNCDDCHMTSKYIDVEFRDMKNAFKDYVEHYSVGGGCVGAIC